MIAVRQPIGDFQGDGGPFDCDVNVYPQFIEAVNYLRALSVIHRGNEIVRVTPSVTDALPLRVVRNCHGNCGRIRVLKLIQRNSG